MKKFFLILVFISFPFGAFAQRTKYVRKEPTNYDFFIPESEMQSQEKEVLPKNYKKIQRGGVGKKSAVVDPNRIVNNLKSKQKNEEAKIEEDEVEEDEVEEDEVIKVGDTSRYYKKIFDDYKKDLKYLKRKNKLPENKERDRDLSKMNSEKEFRVY